MNRLLSWLGRFPVLVLRGPARLAWWSVYPCSSYWRQGGNDLRVEKIIAEHAARPGLVFWDLGAHHGIYSVGVARAVGPGGRVEAFEPDPVSFQRLAWHRKLNRLSWLHTHPVAVSDSDGSARIYQYDGFGSTSTHLPFQGESLAGVPFRDTPTVRLDSWLAEGRVSRPDFIKIDVEGHAGPALAGMRDTFASRPVALVAVHYREEYEAVVQFFTERGYSLQALPSPDGLPVSETFFGELLALPPS